MDTKIPIVFAHGNNESGADWAHVIEAMKKEGYTKLFAIDFLPPMNESNVTYAQQLETFMKTKVLPNIEPHKKVAVLAHSLGVTTTRYYIKNMGGKEHISHCVFIGGANHGIAACDVVLLIDPEGKIYKQAPHLHTGNPPFLQQLNTPGGEEDVKYLTISSPHDHYFSMHEDSPFIDGAENRVLINKGHWGIRDSQESIQLQIAFLEGKINGISIGKALYPHPDRPYGEWNLCSDHTKGQKYTFTEDGKVKYTDGKIVKEGLYKISTQKFPAWIDIDFQDGNICYGVYRLNANGDMLAIKMSNLNGSRPSSHRYADLYYKNPKIACSPKEILGKWKANYFGFMKAFKTSEYIFSLNADGTFIIEGKSLVFPSIKVTGKYLLEPFNEIYKGHLFIEESLLPSLRKNEYYGGLLSIKEGKLNINFSPSSVGSHIAQVIDNPMILDKIE